MKTPLKGMNEALLSAAYRVAKASSASCLFISHDLLKENLEEPPPKGCRVIFVSRLSTEEIKGRLPADNSTPVIHLPKIEMTRMGQVKMAVVLALSKRLLSLGEKVVFLTGAPSLEALDSILFLDTAKEAEILTTQGLNGISDEVSPEVFQETLEIALEIASRGREGKPVGAIFVLGDEEKVLQLSKQMIINPFKGYTDEERNILSPLLRATIREFAALDGAFIISRDGKVLSAGRHLGVTGGEEILPRGLGARHIAAAGMTSLTQAVAIVVSETTGDLRIFKNGKILMQIEKPVTSPTPT